MGGLVMGYIFVGIGLIVFGMMVAVGFIDKGDL